MRLGRLPFRCRVSFQPPPLCRLPRRACPSGPSFGRRLARTMTSSSSSALPSAPSAPPPPPGPFRFGPFDVSTQVFYATARSFALVNLKPLLPGHVLVCPRRPCARLTDLAPAELADLFAAVQRVQRMLAAHYFVGGDDSGDGSGSGSAGGSGQPTDGSFNLAVQDGPEAGQTVAHVHVHVLPRIRGATAKDAATEGDALYEAMAGEPGNVGGAQWDQAREADAEAVTSTPRPVPGGRFPAIEDCQRQARTMAEMEAEAALFRSVLARMGEGSAASAGNDGS